MKITIAKFKPITDNTIQNTPYIRELLAPDYLGVFVHASPQIEDIGGSYTPTHLFGSWYPFTSEPRSLVD